jgi:hypothetical protein
MTFDLRIIEAREGKDPFLMDNKHKNRFISTMHQSYTITSIQGDRMWY